jgi:hypothetical protein
LKIRHQQVQLFPRKVVNDHEVRVQGVQIGPRLNVQPLGARNFRVAHTVQQPFHNGPAEIDDSDEQNDASQVHQKNRHRHDMFTYFPVINSAIFTNLNWNIFLVRLFLKRPQHLLCTSIYIASGDIANVRTHTQTDTSTPVAKRFSDLTCHRLEEN